MSDPGTNQTVETRDKIFVSYRRSDTGGQAGRLAAELRRRFGRHRVFHDSQSSEGGQDFPSHIQQALNQSKVVLAMLGPHWLFAAEKDSGRRRLDQPDDFVRREINYALHTAELVTIPLLVNGVSMPSRQHLPPELSGLVDRQAMALDDEAFDNQLQTIVHRLESLLDDEAMPEWPFKQVKAPRINEHDRALLLEYHRAQRVEHARPPGLFLPQLNELDTIFVDLDLSLDEVLPGAAVVGSGGHRATEASSDPGGTSTRHDTGAAGATLQAGDSRGRTLRQLLSEPGRQIVHENRWVVLGHPGSGKSTLARHLVWELAGEQLAASADAEALPAAGGQANASTAPPHVPLAVYASLPSLAADRAHPFRAAELDLCASRADGAGEGLALALDRAAKTGGVWLLLDGLDEVAPDQRAWIDGQLEQWAVALPKATIAVFSRVVGYRLPGPHYRLRAYVHPLTAGQQQRLLERWLDEPAAVASVQAQLSRSTALREACQVPLSLSLLAFLARSGAEQPSGKRGLYHLGIDTLLQRGHQDAPRGMRNASSARRLLAELSLTLQANAGECWPHEELERFLARLPLDTRRLLHPTWRDEQEFLTELGDRSGVLAPLDGERLPWRFFHRQFRELLAAQALHRQGRSAVIQQAKSLSAEHLQRWAEVLAFACELSEKPLELLLELGRVSLELALRVLPELEGVDALEALSQLAPDRQWDGDFLRGLFARWREQESFDQGNVAAWLWGQVVPRRTRELAAIYFALEDVEGGVNHERFFRACKRWPPATMDRTLTLVQLPAGEFLMGSPEDEPGRSHDEGPQHLVRLSAFQISATAVTNAEYARFDPSHIAYDFDRKLAPDALDRHPVVNVSWWEAYLYCAWAGGDLPTEAQWESACRAGSSAAYSFADALDPKLANTDERALGRTVAVGSLLPNRWGLHEMHGNVWEWCRDRYGEYAATPAQDPSGGTEGGPRVLRGGSWSALTRYARCAYRNHSTPNHRSSDVGFRLVRRCNQKA